MADKIKSMGIKQADGTFGIMIPFGADASNVDFAENKSVADKIGEMDTAIAKNKTDVATKAVKKHDSEADDYGLGSPTKYGHVKIINGLGQAAHEDGTALSAAQGKVLDGKIATEKGRIDTNVSKIATIRTELDQAKTDITGKAPKSHAVTAATYGLGTGTNYGHVKVINNLSQASNADGTALSAYQGKVLNDLVTANTTAIEGKAPTAHASSTAAYGLGNDTNYGHVKIINSLTQASHIEGTALSAYQGKALKTEIDKNTGSISALNSSLILSGYVEITPSDVNQMTQKLVTFSQRFASQPVVVLNATTSVPNIMSYSAGDVLTNSFKIYLQRSTTTLTVISWIAYGVRAN